MMSSSTGRRGEGMKSPPVVYATGIMHVWSHVCGIPRMSAIAGWSSWCAVVSTVPSPRLRAASWKLHTDG